MHNLMLDNYGIIPLVVYDVKFDIDINITIVHSNKRQRGVSKDNCFEHVSTINNYPVFAASNNP